MENDIKEQLKSICKKYNFKYKEYSENKISLCAKNTDKEWRDWIKLDLKNKEVILVGNTDNCNFWFYDTRKDMTPDKIIEFVANLNTMLRKFNDSYLTVKKLIDPEDWQEIAKIQDASADDRYSIKFKCIEFGNVKDNDNYIYCTLLQEGYELDGIFRIHDIENGNDMTLVSIGCNNDKDRNFVNAHWEEIEKKLCEYAKERQNNVDEIEENII